MEHLPRDCLVRILQKCVEEDGDMRYALVCKAWRELASLVQVSMKVKKSANLPAANLIRSIQLFPSLRRLVIEDHGLRRANDCFFRGLADHCPELEVLRIGLLSPSSRVSEHNLEWLFQSCTMLKELSLSSLGDVVHVPSDLSSLTRLESLHLGDWDEVYSWGTYPNISSLPASVSSLVNLRTLSIISRSLYTLPDTVNHLTALKTLKIHSVELVSLPGSIGGLENLEEFHLRSQLLSSLPDSMQSLQRLRRLSLTYCNSLLNLPDSICELENLEVMDISNCYSLIELPSQFGRLKSLKRLRIRGCAQLVQLPPSFSMLESLQELRLQFTRRLSHLPEDIGNVKSLLNLELHTCDRLSCLPDSLGELTNLTNLSIIGCQRISSLPQSFFGLVSLRVLTLNQCISLSFLPQGNSSCELWRARHDDLSLRSLEELGIRDCPIKSLPSSFCHWKLLKKVILEGSHVEIPTGGLDHLKLFVCKDESIMFCQDGSFKAD